MVTKAAGHKNIGLNRIIKLTGEKKSRIVDKGTLYEREVWTDSGSLSGQQEALEGVINEFLAKRAKERTSRVTGKSGRHRKAGYQGRRHGRRVAHEGWMKAVSNNPSSSHPHPFYGEDAERKAPKKRS